MWSIQSSIFYLLWPTFFKNRGTGFCARFYCSECPKSPYFSMVLRDSKYQVLLRYARMCNRFEITRNQFVGNHTWVRIPPAAPRRSKLCIACSDLFYKSDCAHAAAPPFQTANACAGLRFDETGTLVWAHLFRRHNAHRSKLCIACSDLFYKSERTYGELSICSPALQPKILVDNFFGI